MGELAKERKFSKHFGDHDKETKTMHISYVNPFVSKKTWTGGPQLEPHIKTS